MNWFKRHLNWTAALAIPFALFCEFCAGFLIGLAGLGTGRILVDDTGLSAMGLIMYGVIVLAVNGWVLQQKARSLWWLFLVGWFAPIWLSNKT